MEFSEDLDVFFLLKSEGGLADEATAGWGGTVNVLFDRAALNTFGVAGTDPQALCQASDVTASRVGQTLTINGSIYTIRGRDPQDDGAVVLLQLEA